MRPKLLPLFFSTLSEPTTQDRVMRDSFWLAERREEARVIALESARAARTPRR